MDLLDLDGLLGEVAAAIFVIVVNSVCCGRNINQTTRGFKDARHALGMILYGCRIVSGLSRAYSLCGVAGRQGSTGRS